MARNTLPMIPAAYIALVNDAPGRFAPETAKAEHAQRLREMFAECRPAMDAVIDAVNGKASSFTLGSLAAAHYAAETEGRMEKLGVPKALRSGAVASISSSGPSANSYSYRAVGTQITLRRNSKGDWLLVDAKRIDVHPKQSARSTLAVSDAARDAIIRRAMRGIDVLPAPVAA